MARRVILHVGTMKSGTSYLQALLFAQQDELRANGVLVPGQVWGHQAAGIRQALSHQRPRPRWRALRSEMAEHEGDAVISMEFLGPAYDRGAERVLAGLAPAEVEVVVTARDLNRILVSQWQETLQNGRHWTWQEYVDSARALAPGRYRGVDDRTTPGGTFWRQHHTARIVGDWAARVGAQHVTVVTVPPPGAPTALLAERFATATGLPIDTDVTVPRQNESLGLASAIALQQVNATLVAQGHDLPAETKIRKYVLAKTALASRAADEPRHGLRVADWVREQSAATVARLQELHGRGVRLVGAWSDLDPVNVPGISPDEVDPDDVARAATYGLAAVIAEVARPGR